MTVNIDTCARPHVFAITKTQIVFRGRLLGRVGRTAMVRVADGRGVVRTFHARYVFADSWAAMLNES